MQKSTNKEARKVTRVPVVAPDGTPLMPTTPNRAAWWFKTKQAIPKRNKHGVFFVQLLREPSDKKIQDVVVGIDRGTHFTGIAVQTKKATIVTHHVVLPGFYKSSGKGDKKKRHRKGVAGKIEKRAQLRRTRRGRRIDRTKSFKKRNHRQKRFDNRKQSKIPPSVKTNRLMELGVINSLAKILPIKEFRDEECGGSTNKTKSLSRFTVGESWFREQLLKIAPVIEVKSFRTQAYRNFLRLKKDKSDKSKQSPDTHANDAIAIAASHFIHYKKHFKKNERGMRWSGSCVVTTSPFIVITRPQLFRRKLHEENYNKGANNRFERLGGTITTFGFRSGDFVEATKAGKGYKGWIGGFTNTEKSKKVSIYDHNWNRTGQFSPKQTRLIKRSTRYCVVF